MARPTVIEGRVWPVVDASGTYLNDVDTDQIYHNAYLAVTDVDEMGRYAFGNLAGWEDFPTKAEPGDILVVGANFGAGSSRQHAVDCFRTLGVAGVGHLIRRHLQAKRGKRRLASRRMPGLAKAGARGRRRFTAKL